MQEAKDFSDLSLDNNLKTTLKYNTVLVGLGEMGINWLKQLLQEKQINIVSLVDIRKSHGLSIARTYGLPEDIVYPKLGDVFTNYSALDIVVDVTPHSSRKETVITALRNNCHVLSEKPMCASIEEVNELVKVADRSEKTYMVSQNYRWDNSVSKIKSMIDEKTIGEILNINVNFFIGPNFKGYRLKMKHPLLLDMAIHHFDLVRHITSSNADSVYCQEYGHRSYSSFNNCAAACACFEMNSGFVFSYSGNWFTKGEITSWNGQWIINGSKGTICWDGNNIIKLYRVVDGGQRFIDKLESKEIIVTKNKKDKLSLSLKRFLRAISTGKEPQTSYRDNVLTMNMVLGAIKSSEESVKLNLTKEPWFIS